MSAQFSRFLAVGALNTLFGYMIIFSGMYLLKMSPEASNALGYAIGLLLSFILNRTFTFRSKGRRFGEMGRFLLVFAVAYSANLAVLHALVRIFLVNEAVSQVLASAVYIMFSYVMNKTFVFQGKKDDQATNF